MIAADTSSMVAFLHGDDGDDVGAGKVGELWVRGPGVLKGYWNAPDATADTVIGRGDVLLVAADTKAAEEFTKQR